MDFRNKMRSYRQNRPKISPEEIRKHRGEWVAFSGDGRSIVGSDADLAVLLKSLATAGVDQQDVVFEQIPSTDTFFGGAEFQ
jgi:alkanesulfonate monooxygenase SsuD/methylene tetrahydromethanopterin reductase-like flavin-dependent oxidoreductase (luciferase family)